LPGSAGVRALALLNEQLFVTRSGISSVTVYDTNTFEVVRQLTWSGLSPTLPGLATCAINNYLYVSDYTLKLHQVDLSVTSPVTVNTWHIGVTPSGTGLSTTSNGDIVATVVNTMGYVEVRVYNSSGTLLRTISWPNSPVTVMELSNAVWAYCSGANLNGVCKTTTSGIAITACYQQSTIQPTDMAIDARGYFLLADNLNHIILQVDPTLTTGQTLVVPLAATDSFYPYCIKSDPSSGRLYVGEGDGQYRILVFDGY